MLELAMLKRPLLSGVAIATLMVVISACATTATAST